MLSHSVVAVCARGVGVLVIKRTLPYYDGEAVYLAEVDGKEACAAPSLRLVVYALEHEERYARAAAEWKKAVTAGPLLMERTDELEGTVSLSTPEGTLLAVVLTQELPDVLSRHPHTVDPVYREYAKDTHWHSQARHQLATLWPNLSQELRRRSAAYERKFL